MDFGLAPHLGAAAWHTRWPAIFIPWGVILFELLTERTPLDGTSRTVLPELAHDSEPPLTRTLSPGLPRGIPVDSR